MKIKQDRDKYNIGKNICEFCLAQDMTQEQVTIRLQLRGIGMPRGGEITAKGNGERLILNNRTRLAHMAGSTYNRIRLVEYG